MHALHIGYALRAWAVISPPTERWRRSSMLKGTISRELHLSLPFKGIDVQSGYDGTWEIRVAADRIELIFLIRQRVSRGPWIDWDVFKVFSVALDGRSRDGERNRAGWSFHDFD